MWPKYRWLKSLTHIKYLSYIQIKNDTKNTKIKTNDKLSYTNNTSARIQEKGSVDEITLIIQLN